MHENTMCERVENLKPKIINPPTDEDKKSFVLASELLHELLNHQDGLLHAKKFGLI